MTLSPTETLSKTVQGDSRYVLHLMQPNSSAAGSHQQPSTASSQPKPQRDQVTVVNVDNSTPRSYTILKEVGDGSFGTVWLADWHSPLDLPPGTLPPGPSNRPEYKGKKLVAIKRMKKAFLGGWSECLKLKELYSLKSIPMHPHIIPLYDAFLLPSTKELYFIFECMEGNLYQLTKSRKGRPLAGGLTASILHQIVLGLHHVHSNGFFHRDMKPENLLITTTGLADYPPTSHIMFPVLPSTPFQLEKDVVCTVKLADFGLAREIASKPPYTEYVSTRWYRSPEILLRSRDYSAPVDIWALGTIVAEMVTLKPLFPGSTEIDQVLRICQLLGDPVKNYGRDSRDRLRGGGQWQQGIKLAQQVGFQWPEAMPMHFASVFDQNTVPLELINLITNTLRYEPTIRLTAEQCLQHPYLTQVAPKLRPVTDIPRYQQQLLQSALHAQQRQQNSSFTSSANNSQTSLASVNSGQSYASQPTPTSMTPEGARSQVWRQPRRMANSASTVSLPGTPAPSVVSQASHDLPPWSHTSHTRQPTAGSSKYADRSIFEGIAPQRDYANTGIAQAQATVFDDAYSVQLQMEEKRQAREKEFRAAQQKQQQDETSQQPPHLSPPSHKSKGWSLSSVFHQDASKQPSSPSLRHSASTRSLRNGTSESAAPTDPKKAKKLAERAAKEAERAKREAASQLARERARAVMQKKSQLANRGQDIFSTAGPNSNAVPEPAPRMLPPMRQGESSRSFLQEDPSVTGSVDSRWKSRRRHDDDDIHSVSSNETHNSRNSGNEPRYSFSSYNTMDSESLPQSAWSPQATSLSRNATASSLGSTGRSPALDQFFQHHGNQSLPPKSSSSSVDSSLLRNFQGLSAADAQRLRSPFGVTSAPMDSSYPMPSAPGPGTTFVPALHSLGSRQSSANSYSSFHSMPTLPSQQQYSNLAAPSEHQEDDPMQTDS